MTTTSEAVAEAEAQGTLRPGDEGWWKVWGASVQDVRVGDLVAVATGDGGPAEWHLVEALFESKAAPLRRGFVSDGGRWTVGVLCGVAVMRRSTHNVLADSVR